ncbi:MAG: diaminopimelate epimerase [Bacteroidota bacterium]
MNIPFEKYHGTGNDFIIIDIRHHAIPDDPEMIGLLCDRHYGIGADGLIMLSASAGNDFRMRYFNADGREASLCGNGGRCIAAFAHKHGIIKEEAHFTAADGDHSAYVLAKKGNTYTVSLEMQDVKIAHWKDGHIFLDTGSPHLVKECEGLSTLDVFTEGKKLRHAPTFAPEGTNVNFVEEAEGVLNIRTYERGVEDETLSCGTGVTATAIARAIRDDLGSPVHVKAIGGTLKVSFIRTDTHFTSIKLEGPAEFVFKGEVEI